MFSKLSPQDQHSQYFLCCHGSARLLISSASLSPSHWPTEERKSCCITQVLFNTGLSKAFHHFLINYTIMVIHPSCSWPVALRMKRSRSHDDKALPVSCDVSKWDRFCRSGCKNITTQWMSRNVCFWGREHCNSAYDICMQQTFGLVSICYFLFCLVILTEWPADFMLSFK